MQNPEFPRCNADYYYTDDNGELTPSYPGIQQAHPILPVQWHPQVTGLKRKREDGDAGR